jgi:fatty-acyl-CoA synthase
MRRGADFGQAAHQEGEELMINTTDVRPLVHSDRVHSDLYTSPEIFQAEMDRIFHRGWVYVAHASEIPHPGDYVRKTIGTQPVIVARDRDDNVHVLLNRCSHLANLLCHDARGNSSTFRCPYHFWTFKNTGELVGTPYPGGYGRGFDRSGLNLAQAAHIAAHRGFIFASLGNDVPPLMDYLGPAAEALDRLCAFSPEGEVELTSGWLRHQTAANWKIVYENDIDGYHGNFVHRSMTIVANWTLIGEGDVTSEKSASRVRYLGNGHAELDWRPQFRKVGQKYLWLGAGNEERLAGYAASLAEVHGAQRAEEMLVDGPPHTLIFPNLYIGELFIMALQPVSPGETIQHQTAVRWKGAETFNRRVLQQTGASLGPFGMVVADDTAMYERNYSGMAAKQPEWLIRSRGLEREEVLADGTEESNVTDDTAHRGFWRDYVAVMTERTAVAS